MRITPQDLDRATFLREYVKKGVPVVVRGACADWPAMSKWDFRFFAEEFGNIEVPAGGVTGRGST